MLIMTWKKFIAVSLVYDFDKLQISFELLVLILWSVDHA
jgi:hypothetical protein